MEKQRYKLEQSAIYCSFQSHTHKGSNSDHSDSENPQHYSIDPCPINMSILSPCDSCSTFQSTPVQYNNKLFNTYLAARLSAEQSDEQEEIVLSYGESHIYINTSSVLNLVNSNSTAQIKLADITINHLIAYILYYQVNLSLYPEEIYINQIQLLHCGQKYLFVHDQTSPKMASLNNWSVTRRFHLVISNNSSKVNIYKYFNVENYLSAMHSVPRAPSSMNRLISRFRRNKRKLFFT